MPENPLKQITDLGQSLWFDNIERSMITEGKLTRLIAEDYIVGVTSNPTIFQKAISGSALYDAQIQEIVAQTPTIPVKDLFESLAIQDIQGAADILQPVYERTNGAGEHGQLQRPGMGSERPADGPASGTMAHTDRLGQR